MWWLNKVCLTNMPRVLHSTKKSIYHRIISKSKTIPFISNLGEPRDFTCKVKSEGGDGSFYQPPEMQWMIGDGYPSNNKNDYEKVNRNLEIKSVYARIKFVKHNLPRTI